MKKKIIIIALITFLIDQIIKYFVYNYLSIIKIIPNIFSLYYVENKGIAFSMMNHKTILIIILSIILIAVLINILNKDYIKKGNNSKLITISFGLMFGGIFGNLIDRITRGLVIDYISILDFPIFNFADICITIGIILILISSFFKTYKIDKL